MQRAIKLVDFSVLEGHRDCDKQNEAYAAGFSKAVCGKSKHNSLPALAIDICPYPFKPEYWNQPEVWAGLAKIILDCAQRENVAMRWGGDWNQNGKWEDESFFDGAHFELME